jgi:hypothetical protein
MPVAIPRIVATTTNILAGLSWIAGPNTSISYSAGRARATNTGTGGADNPRLFKHLTGLNSSKTYRFQGTIYHGNAVQNMFFRVSTSVNIPNGDVYQWSSSTNDALNDTFTGQTDVYIGLVVISEASPPTYCEIDDPFSLIML